VSYFSLCLRFLIDTPAHTHTHTHPNYRMIAPLFRMKNQNSVKRGSDLKSQLNCLSYATCDRKVVSSIASSPAENRSYKSLQKEILISSCRHVSHADANMKLSTDCEAFGAGEENCLPAQRFLNKICTWSGASGVFLPFEVHAPKPCTSLWLLSSSSLSAVRILNKVYGNSKVAQAVCVYPMFYFFLTFFPWRKAALLMSCPCSLYLPAVYLPCILFLVGLLCPHMWQSFLNQPETLLVCAPWTSIPHMQHSHVNNKITDENA